MEIKNFKIYHHIYIIRMECDHFESFKAEKVSIRSQKQQL